MDDHAGHCKGYVRLSVAYGAAYERQRDRPDEVDAVLFGYYRPAGGDGGGGGGVAPPGAFDEPEAAMRWPGGRWPQPELVADPGSWVVLAEHPQLFAALAARQWEGLRPEEFCALLEACGFAELRPDPRPLDVP